jgi:hypothetical protein
MLASCPLTLFTQKELIVKKKMMKKKASKMKKKVMKKKPVKRAIKKAPKVSKKKGNLMNKADDVEEEMEDEGG